jgi:hypothetical protein
MISKITNYTVPIMLTICVIFSTSTKAFVGADTKENLISENTIDSQFENRKHICEKKNGDIRGICITEAEGNRDIAKAKLKAKIEPTLENEVDYRIAIAEAKYALSVKKCQKSDVKSSCIDKAKALKGTEIEDARAVRH